MDPHEAARLADAATFSNVFHHANEFFLRQGRAEEGSPFAFRESRVAGPAPEHTAFFVGTIPVANSEVFRTAFAEIGTVRILTTEARQIIMIQTPESNPRKQNPLRRMTANTNNPSTRQYE